MNLQSEVSFYAEMGANDLAGWRAWVDYPIDVRRGAPILRSAARLSAPQTGIAGDPHWLSHSAAT